MFEEALSPTMPVTLNTLVLLLQAVIVVGGGFWMAGRLGAKLDHLTNAIEGLRESSHERFTDHETRIRKLEMTESGAR
jgi:hypothetical protein